MKIIRERINKQGKREAQIKRLTAYLHKATEVRSSTPWPSFWTESTLGASHELL